MELPIFELSCCTVAGRELSRHGLPPFADTALSLQAEWRSVPCGRVLTARLTVQEPLTLEALRFELPCELLPTDRVFLNGYQSWTDSLETTPGTLMHGLNRVPKALLQKYGFAAYGDYTFARYPDAHGFSYGYRRRGEEYLLMASLGEQSGFTVLYLDADAQRVTVEKECNGLRMSAGQTLDFSVAVLQGDENAVFDAWFALLGIQPPCAKVRWGYTSWYQHYQNISESLLLNTLAHAPKEWEIFQIDDGWEPAIGDWEADPEKFPHGMAPLAQAITKTGRTPGLWLAPFAVQKDAALCAQHPGWLVRDAAGKPVLCGSNWGGFYALNFELPEVRAHLRVVFDRVVRQWGYRLLKLDFLYAVCLCPPAEKTRGQVMCEAIDFLRECAGDAQILGCGVPLMPAFGKVEYCRIGTDVSLQYDDLAYMRFFHRERISTRYSVQNTVFRRQLNGRAFCNDPDVYLLRRENNRLTFDQKKVLATVNALYGGLWLTSDDPGAYGVREKTLALWMRQLCGAVPLQAERQGKLLVLTYRTAKGVEKNFAFEPRSGRVQHSASGKRENECR